MVIIVTGGAGFIGSELVRQLLADASNKVVVYDKLTYAGTKESLRYAPNQQNLEFVEGDICDLELARSLFRKFQPDRIMHLAAESHVDRSIDSPMDFVKTNVIGTCTLLQAALEYWRGLSDGRKDSFRFQHISTDEVYGSLGDKGYFLETTPYSPRSPYSASKASSDHFVRAWHTTFGLPIVMSNCSNNYGAYQFPEKLIPLVTINALEGRPLPVYGTGANIRDWIYVEDHVRALRLIGDKGRVGETYNVGGHSERRNIEVVQTICDVLDGLVPSKSGKSYREQIVFVKDRPGHDARYAIDSSKIESELGWRPQQDFTSGIRQTIKWYLDNEWWWRPLREGRYDGTRLGNAK